MVFEPPPIQQETTSNSGKFPQVWIRWFEAIEERISSLYSVNSGSNDTVLNSSSYNWFGNTDGGGLTFTLPVGESGEMYRIVNTGTSSNILKIDPNGSDKLFGVNSSFSLFDGEALIVAYEETQGWY